MRPGGLIEEKREAFFALSDRVWDTPELNYEEIRSAAEHTAMLEREGFRVQTGIAGLPTAMMGEAGEGGPVIAILGEYDALPGLSQEAGVAEQRPVAAGGNGHGCGHNLLGAGVAARRDGREGLARRGTASPAACAITAARPRRAGRPRGSWCAPACSTDVDVAICWHPAPFTGVNNPISLACNEIELLLPRPGRRTPPRRRISGAARSTRSSS